MRRSARSEAVQNHRVLFLYYNEAPILEESFPASKGSFPRPHHGCWASVVLEDDRVTDIGYRSVPQAINAVDHCEAIFEQCRPSRWNRPLERSAPADSEQCSFPGILP